MSVRSSDSAARVRLREQRGDLLRSSGSRSGAPASPARHAVVPPETKLLIGSTTTVSARTPRSACGSCARCISRPSSVGRDAWMCSSPHSDHRARGQRRSSACCGRAGSATPRTRSTGSARRAGSRRRAKWPRGSSCRCPPCPTRARAAAVVALAAEHRVQLRHAARDPLVGRLVVQARATVTGSTEMPALVDQERILVRAVTRAAVLHDRSRRVDTCSDDAVIEQDHAVGDVFLEPWRVSAPSPRSPVMIAVTPLSLSQRNRRRSSERRIAWFENPPNSDSIVSSTTRLAPTESIASPRRMKSPSRSNSPVSSISLRSTRT